MGWNSEGAARAKASGSSFLVVMKFATLYVVLSAWNVHTRLFYRVLSDRGTDSCFSGQQSIDWVDVVFDVSAPLVIQSTVLVLFLTGYYGTVISASLD